MARLEVVVPTVGVTVILLGLNLTEFLPGAVSVPPSAEFQQFGGFTGLGRVAGPQPFEGDRRSRSGCVGGHFDLDGVDFLDMFDLLQFDHDLQVSWQVGNESAVFQQCLTRLVKRDRSHTECHRADGSCPESEFRDDCKAAASSAQRPEQVGVVLGVDVQESTVAVNNGGADEGVAGQAAASAEPADATTKGDPAHPRVGTTPAGTARWWRARARSRSPRSATTDSDGLPFGVDVGVAETGEVDDHTVVHHRPAGDLMTAAPD